VPKPDSLSFWPIITMQNLTSPRTHTACSQRGRAQWRKTNGWEGPRWAPGLMRAARFRLDSHHAHGEGSAACRPEHCGHDWRLQACPWGPGDARQALVPCFGRSPMFRCRGSPPVPTERTTKRSGLDPAIPTARPAATPVLRNAWSPQAAACIIFVRIPRVSALGFLDIPLPRERERERERKKDRRSKRQMQLDGMHGSFAFPVGRTRQFAGRKPHAGAAGRTYRAAAVNESLPNAAP
jgi:hypothetical protein